MPAPNEGPGPPAGGRVSEPVRAYPVMRTVRALELLAFRPMSAPELAHAVHSAERTARRLLQRLELEDYVTHTGGYRRRYQVTLRLAALGRQAIAHTAWLHAAAPQVATLATQTGATARLWIPAYSDVACVLEAHPGGPVPEPILGDLVPAHASAPGKALVAHRQPWRDSLLSRQPERDSPRPTAARGLDAELQRVRARGHATEHDEHCDENTAIAAPVFLGDDVTAALGITLSDAVGPRELDALAAHVMRLAKALSAALNRAGS